MHNVSMNLLKMLESANKPVVSACKPRKPRSGNKSPQHVLANRAKRAQAIEHYKAVVTSTWTATREFETRLGMARSSCLPVLRKWEQLGIMESRPIGTGFNRRHGIEWRFKDEA